MWDLSLINHNVIILTWLFFFFQSKILTETDMGLQKHTPRAKKDEYQHNFHCFCKYISFKVLLMWLPWHCALFPPTLYSHTATGCQSSTCWAASPPTVIQTFHWALKYHQVFRSSIVFCDSVHVSWEFPCSSSSHAYQSKSRVTTRWRQQGEVREE